MATLQRDWSRETAGQGKVRKKPLASEAAEVFVLWYHSLNPNNTHFFFLTLYETLSSVEPKHRFLHCVAKVQSFLLLHREQMKFILEKANSEHKDLDTREWSWGEDPGSMSVLRKLGQKDPETSEKSSCEGPGSLFVTELSTLCILMIINFLVLPSKLKVVRLLPVHPGGSLCW